MKTPVLITIMLFGATFICAQKRNLNENIVIAAINSQPDGLHAFNNNSSVRSFIFNYTQKTLIKLDMKLLEYIPHLVEDMPKISEDGLQYTYKIKKGIKWDDGTSFTSKDVAFSTKLMLCPLTDNTQIRSNYNAVIQSIQTYPEDPYKFTMHAKKIHVSNKNIFSELYMQQQQKWDANGLLNNLSFEDIHNENWKASELIENWFVQFNHADNSYVADNLVGLGPYQVTEFKAGQYITLEKKKNWWGERSNSKYNKAYPDRIIFKVITDEISVELALENQTIDVSTSSISTKKLIDLRKDDNFNQNYHSEFIDRFAFNYLGLNTKPDGINHKKFFIDKKVRRAMAYLTPIDKIIKVMVYGHAIRQTSNISPLKSSYNDTLKEIPLDIEKAKTLLDEAGWVDTDGDNIRDKVIDGIKTPFTFNFSYMSSATSTKIVLMIQASMRQAGVNAIPYPMDSLFYERAQNHEFDAMLAGWGGSASYSNPMQLWHTTSWSDNGSNFCGFGDAESDALIEEANTSIDPQEHKEALWKLQAKIYEEQPYVFLYSSKKKIAIHKRFYNRNMYTEHPYVLLNNLKLKRLK